MEEQSLSGQGVDPHVHCQAQVRSSILRWAPYCFCVLLTKGEIMEKELVDGYRVLAEGMEKCPCCGALCCGNQACKDDDMEDESEGSEE